MNDTDHQRSESFFDIMAGQMKEDGVTYMVSPRSRKEPKVCELISVLISWLNTELDALGMLVRDLEEDLYDGLVLGKLLAKLGKSDINRIEEISGVSDSPIEHRSSVEGVVVKIPEVVGSVIEQRQKVEKIINFITDSYGVQTDAWDARRIHEKDLVAILHLLVFLARYFDAQVAIPDDVTIELIYVTKQHGNLKSENVPVQITGSEIDRILSGSNIDAFDELFMQASDEKLNRVVEFHRDFVERILSSFDESLVKDGSMPLNVLMHDGVNLIFIIGFTENCFIPFHEFHLAPRNKLEKLHNVKFAFQLMKDCRMATPKALPENIVAQDLKAILRVIYIIYSYNKNRKSSHYATYV